ncbi:MULTISPECIES: 16S rRNA (cytosine(967)-C(5))-methyltransferase RsmB [unclassified Roseateles]|uniref:16S rRNA (cytosine(967)-C(5))-methyltransferase RsmB n=1 Tax=unclassified Roseateles TaxID=2626991 RepID=UPI0006F329BE|nr:MULTISPECIES: 16S rRNA (cytosine(967)-C(5))-methyltransferase RsmB [unclassified Roseateles]KQW45810.1 16S rRNA methyltransferase [Pelomonas sp. Root405]KRA72654.1 16S rRNA methyltransferase [Pelomonas sp. Root662]
MTSTPQSAPLHRLLSQAADAVQGVREGRSLTDLLAKVPADLRPGSQALAFTTLRRLGGAEAARQQLAPKAPPPRVDALLLTALALLWPETEPDAAPMYADHTLVDQAVHAAKLRAPASAAFINAVLRRFLRERPAMVAAAERSPLGAYNHPAWWVEKLRQDWPAQWQAILAASNRAPPMTLRVHAQRGSVADYAQRLAALGLAARPLGAATPQALVLDKPAPVSALPGFAEGLVSVQDAAAQLAAPLVIGAGLKPGARVLDACAAPGGKTAHLLELQPDLQLTALDADAQRLIRVQDTLNRLGQQATLKAADARQTAAWWDRQPFDAVLLDAPCSASGIVRRHPDVRWLRRPDDITALARTQAELLDALWPLLAPGGRLVYATCSVFRAEGQAQLDAFLQRQPTAKAHAVPGFTGHLLPVAENAQQPQPPLDGFFYALLTKP